MPVGSHRFVGQTGIEKDAARAWVNNLGCTFGCWQDYRIRTRINGSITPFASFDGRKIRETETRIVSDPRTLGIIRIIRRSPTRQRRTILDFRFRSSCGGSLFSLRVFGSAAIFCFMAAVNAPNVTGSRSISSGAESVALMRQQNVSLLAEGKSLKIGRCLSTGTISIRAEGTMEFTRTPQSERT